MKKLLWFGLLPIALFAQPRKDSRQLVALPVSYPPDQIGSSNEFYLVTDKPACVRLKLYQTFVLQSAWHKEGDSTVGIGLGTVAAINNKNAELKATLHPGKQVQKGDVAMFLVALKPPGKDSLFFKLARHAIGLTTVDDSLFYDRNKMLETPGFYATEKLATAMAADIKYTATAMLQQQNAQDQLVNVGKYKGQQLFALMQQCTVADVLAFIRYVYHKPQKYMAHTWKVSETFATWVVNGAP